MVNYKKKKMKKILRGSEATGAKEQLLPEAEEWAVGNKGPESLPTGNVQTSLKRVWVPQRVG